MNDLSTKSCRDTASTRREAPSAYTFRSMRELDESIERSNARVSKAERQLKEDYRDSVLLIKEDFFWKCIAGSVNLLKLARGMFSVFLKKK